MYLAIINDSTKKVENIIVPPQGADVWFVPTGYTAIETTAAAIGDTYEGGEFISPQPPEEE